MALVIVGAAVVFVVWPFSISSYQPPAATGSETSFGIDSVGLAAPRSRCGPAIIDAWHEKQPQGGWFGYAPFSNERLIGPEPACRSASQHRLRLANLVLLVALALALVASTAERRASGHGPAPSLAI